MPGAPAGRCASPVPCPTRPSPGTDTIPQIKHIVVLMMENHSYDNQLGMLAGRARTGSRSAPTAGPRRQPYPDGDIQHAFRMPTTCQLGGSPARTGTDSHTPFDGGARRRFREVGQRRGSMGYWQWADQPFYYSLASAFPIADRYFCSVLGQTFPNRRYLWRPRRWGWSTTPCRA